MANTHRARVGGSGFTTFRWEFEVIAFCRQVGHRSPTPVGPGTVPIHPMNEPHPKELITAQAATMGELTLEIYELYGQTIWEDLKFLAGSNDIVDIFKAVTEKKPEGLTVVKRVDPPKGPQGKSGSYGPSYRQIFHGVKVSQVMDNETIEVGTMEVLKQIVVNYTHYTRDRDK